MSGSTILLGSPKIHSGGLLIAFVLESEHPPDSISPLAPDPRQSDLSEASTATLQAVERPSRRRARSPSSDSGSSSLAEPASTTTREHSEGACVAAQEEEQAETEPIADGLVGSEARGSSSGRPSRKRRRLAGNMRLEKHPANPHPSSSARPYSNGSSLSPLHKAALNRSTNGTNGKSRSHNATNGSTVSHANGSTASSSRVSLPDYFGHDREEVTRILIQSLVDLGYHAAASTLTRESGYEVESPAAAAFRSSVLQGEWADAERLLLGESSQDGEAGIHDDDRDYYLEGGLVLAAGADKNQMLFSLRQQKYLELLEERDLGAALMVLRQELTPLHKDVGRLHALSR